MAGPRLAGSRLLAAGGRDQHVFCTQGQDDDDGAYREVRGVQGARASPGGPSTVPPLNQVLINLVDRAKEATVLSGLLAGEVLVDATCSVIRFATQELSSLTALVEPGFLPEVHQVVNAFVAFAKYILDVMHSGSRGSTNPLGLQRISEARELMNALRSQYPQAGETPGSGASRLAMELQPMLPATSGAKLLTTGMVHALSGFAPGDP